MSVALSNGASVIAFIGLTAQTLHGILYIYEIIENIQEAPGDLRCLYIQLKFFQLAFSTFRESVAKAARLGILARLDEQTRLALDDAEETIKELQFVVQKYGEGRATGLQKKIKVAFRRKQMTKLPQRLSNISARVEFTHTSIALMAQMHRPVLPSTIAPDLESQFLILRNNIPTIPLVAITQQFESVNEVLNQATESIFELITELSQKIDQIPYESSNLYSTRRDAGPSTLSQQLGDRDIETRPSLYTGINEAEELISMTIDTAIQELFPPNSDHCGGHTLLCSQEVRAAFHKSLIEHHTRFRSDFNIRGMNYIFFNISPQVLQPAPILRVLDYLTLDEIIYLYFLYFRFQETWLWTWAEIPLRGEVPLLTKLDCIAACCFGTKTVSILAFIISMLWIRGSLTSRVSVKSAVQITIMIFLCELLTQLIGSYILDRRFSKWCKPRLTFWWEASAWYWKRLENQDNWVLVSNSMDLFMLEICV